MRHADRYTRLILEEVSAGRGASQRCLARQLGIALGRTNSLTKALVERGWVAPRASTHSRGPYALTPAGRRHLAHLTRHHMQETVAVYAAARERLVALLASVSAACGDAGEAGKRVAFYGAGDMAEVAYAALRRTDLLLVGVVDEERHGRFFEHPIQPGSELQGDRVAGVAFDRLLVMMPDLSAGPGARLRARAVPPDRICWL